MSRALIRTNRNYRLLLSASSVSNLGDEIAMVALPWLATMLTSDPLLISAVATAQRLPWLLFSLPVGVWTDRADRRLLMFRADLVRVALMVFTVLMIVSQTSMPMPEGAGMTAILSLVVIAFLLASRRWFAIMRRRRFCPPSLPMLIWSALMARCGVPSRSPASLSAHRWPGC